jgi:PAS domain S-box-containing protein
MSDERKTKAQLRAELEALRVRVEALQRDEAKREQVERRRRQAERQQRQAQDELARQIQERTARLQALNRQLEQEVADRKHAEEVLKASERLYHSTIDAMDDIIHVVGRDLRITLVNTALRRRCVELGIPLDGVIGRSVFDLFPFLPDSVREEYQKVLESGRPHHGCERTHLAGQEIWTETLKVPILEGGRVERILTVVRDVTDRERSRAELEESEAKYRQLFEMESDAVFLIEGDSGQILEVNSAASEMYGYGREELLTRRGEDLMAGLEGTTEATQPLTFSAPLSYHRKKDGAVFPVEIMTSSFAWRGRDVHLAAIRDITDRKRAEEEMVRLERLRALGEMSAGVSHNLNNILTGILGPAQLLMMDPNAESVARELRTICDSAIRARDLVQRLHQSVRGHEEQLAEPVDLTAIATEAIRTTQPRWKD